jgi:hypothetical protein
MRKPVAPCAPTGKQAKVIHDLPHRRIAHQESGHPPRATIAGDADDVLDVGQRWARDAVLTEFEGYAW